MARAYLRLDPGFFDRKVIDQKYPPGAAIALVGALCHAEHQPQRGRFRDVRVLKALLGPLAKWIPFLIERRDLVSRRGVLYVDGWDEWQEGDWKVGERVRRIRNRAKDAPDDPAVTVDVTPDVTPDVTVATVANESVPTVAPVTVETVYNLSDGGRQSVIDSGGGSGKHAPPTPSARGHGSRANGTNPRALVEQEAKGKRQRARERQQAYLRGELTEDQVKELAAADAEPGDPAWLAVTHR